jgi:hypothetical protein
MRILQAVVFILVIGGVFGCRLKNKELLDKLVLEHKTLEEEHITMEAAHDSLQSNFLVIMEKRVKRLEDVMDSLNMRSSTFSKIDSSGAPDRDADLEFAKLIDRHSKLIQDHGTLLNQHEDLIRQMEKGRTDLKYMESQDNQLLERDKKLKKQHEEITHSFIVIDM